MRRLALSASVVLAVTVGLVLLRPVLLAPVTGDDRVNALESAADPDRTILTEIAELPAEWDYRVSVGRVNVLTAFERNVSSRAMVETAVATGRPVHQVLGVYKIGYAALSLFAGCAAPCDPTLGTAAASRTMQRVWDGLLCRHDLYVGPGGGFGRESLGSGGRIYREIVSLAGTPPKN